MNAHGSVLISLSDKLTGEKYPLLDLPAKNLEVYQSGDATAKMVDPQKNFAIRYIYFEFRNAAPAVPTPDLGDDISIYSGLSAPDDYLRVPILAAPAYDVKAGEEAEFNGNRVTFFGTTKAAPTDSGGDVVGEANGEILTDGTSVIHTVGLVASDGRKENDLLFARMNISPGTITKQAGYDVDIHWSLHFGPAIP